MEDMSDTQVQIAFPKVDTGSTALVMPVAPVGVVNEGLAVSAASAQGRQALECKSLLLGETLVRANREAADLLPKMLSNTEVLMQYGESSLEGVNSLIDKLLHDVEPVKIPEVKKMMSNLNREMRGIKRKYDVSDPKVKEKYDNWKGGMLGFIHSGRSLLDLLMDDVKSIEKQLDSVEKDLDDRAYQMRRNVSYYDSLYEQNEAEIVQVIYVIGVMELIRDLAAKAAGSITDEDSSDPRHGERKAKIAELAANMELRISDYKARLFVAWATAPQVRTMRALNVSLALRLNSMIKIGIPTMKGTILQWRVMIESQDAGKVMDAVGETVNDQLTNFFGAAGQIVPMIADTVNAPMLKPETVFAMADSILAQANGIVQAMQAGADQRAELDSAMVKSKQVIDSAANTVSDAIVDRIVATASTPLEISQSVLV